MRCPPAPASHPPHAPGFAPVKGWMPFPSPDEVRVFGRLIAAAAAQKEAGGEGEVGIVTAAARSPRLLASEKWWRWHGDRRRRR